MPAQMTINQAGLPAGIAGFARTDGLRTGALVTLSSVGGGSTHSFRLLWVPPGDTTAVSSLSQTGPTTWTFSPTANVYGTYRILLVVDAGLSTESRQVRSFVVRTPNAGLIIPAANEVADPSVDLTNVSSAYVQRSEQNEPFGPFSSGSAWGWWRSMSEAITAVDNAGQTALLDVSMTDAAAAAAQLGTPTFVRRSGGFNTWDGLGIPTLTAGVSVPSYPSQTGLQFALSATIAGGWVYPLSGLNSIPAGGVALEVDIGAQDSGIEVIVMPIARFSGGNVTGFSMRHFDNQAQIDSNLVDLAGPSPNTGTVQSTAWNMNYSFPTTPNLNRSLNKVRYEVVADGPQTPARWRVSGFASNTAALSISPPNAAGVSGAADAVPAWDGQARPTLGLGIYRFGSGTGSMVLTRIQVFAL